MPYEHIQLVGAPSATQWSAARVFSVDSMIVAAAWTVPTAQIEDGKAFGDMLAAAFAAAVNAQGFVDTMARATVSEFAAVFVDAHESVVCVRQAGRVAMVRAGTWHTLLTGSTATATAQFARGTMVPGDTIVVGTAGFWTHYGALLEKASSIAQETTHIATALTARQDAGDCAAVVIDLKVKDTIGLPATQPEHVSVPKHASVDRTVRVPSRPRRSLRAQVLLTLSSYRKILVLLAFVALLIVGFVVISRLALSRRSGRITSILAPYQQRFDEANALSDPIAQIQAYRNLREDVAQVQTQYKSDAAIARELDRLLLQVTDAYTAKANEKNIEKMSVFYDFRLISSDFVASTMAFDAAGKLAVFIDGTHRRMLSIAIETKQPQTLSLPDALVEASAVAVADRKAYVLGKNGIVEMSLPLEEAGRMAITATAEWQSPTLLGVYDKYLYAVDTGRRGLFRFDTSDPGASPSAWLRDREGIEWEQLSSLIVDGDVWFGTQAGEVLRFRRGERENFKLTGPLDLPTSRIAVFTREESELVYILEPRAQRILVFSKSGEYRSSVTSSDLATATSLIVDESTKTAYVLAGSLVYAVEIAGN